MTSGLNVMINKAKAEMYARRRDSNSGPAVLVTNGHCTFIYKSGDDVEDDDEEEDNVVLSKSPHIIPTSFSVLPCLRFVKLYWIDSKHKVVPMIILFLCKNF